MSHYATTSNQSGTSEVFGNIKAPVGGAWKGRLRGIRKWLAANSYAATCGYLMGCLSDRTGTNLDLDCIWREQKLSSGLEELMRSWSHAINKAITESAQGRNVTEWAKKEECWKTVKNLDLPVPNELPIEMQTGITGAGRRYAPGEELTPQDYENIKRCKEVDGETWLRIYAWGQKSGILKKWQYGIAQTLSTYAAAGWERSPSPKQAKHGAGILNLAREHGELGVQ